jgi:hypothetical protein
LEGVAVPINIVMSWNPKYSNVTLPTDRKDYPSYWATIATKVPEKLGLPHFSDVHIWNIKATGAKKAFSVAAYPNATLDDFYFDHIDIEAATAGTIDNIHHWTVTNSSFKTADGSTPVFADSTAGNAGTKAD